ncbi:MAG TPA: mycofactocin precursor MftA [Acidimicrobiales bacterium]|nr:mycofactocin precursor MftA [Acidimicrobiales bacterium]
MSQPTDTAARAARTPDSVLRREEELEDELDELLVEEISIDGMCGVY